MGMVSLPPCFPDSFPRGGQSYRRASNQPRANIRVNHRMNRTNRRASVIDIVTRGISTNSIPGAPIHHAPGFCKHGCIEPVHRGHSGPSIRELDFTTIFGKLAALQQNIKGGGIHVRDVQRKVWGSSDPLCDDFWRLFLCAKVR